MEANFYLFFFGWQSQKRLLNPIPDSKTLGYYQWAKPCKQEIIWVSYSRIKIVCDEILVILRAIIKLTSQYSLRVTSVSYQTSIWFRQTTFTEVSEWFTGNVKGQMT